WTLVNVKLLRSPRQSRGISQLIKFVSNDGQLTDEAIDRLRNALLDRYSNRYDPPSCPDLRLVFGVILYSAQRFERHGLNYHATIAYLKLISLWACLTECIPFTALNEVKPRKPLSKEASNALRCSEKWLSSIRKAAMRNAISVHGGAFSDAWWKIWHSDISSWIEKSSINYEESDEENTKKEIKKQCENLDKKLEDIDELEPGPGARNIDDLFITECKTADRILKFWASKEPEFLKKTTSKKDISEEVAEWNFSLLAQKLVFVTMWQRALCFRIQPKEPCINTFPIIEFPPIKFMVPSTVRSLLFAHWLAGRTRTWRVISNIRRKNYFKKSTEKSLLYRQAGRAAHNLYRAHFYIRDMCGNDQDLMFPSPALVIHSLWALLHELVKVEIVWLEKNEGGKTSPPRYAKAVRNVRKCLAEESDKGTPGYYFDYNLVTDRLQAYLRDVEQLSDLSSHARAEVLKGKFFLADDYEDPRFHLDWTMIQILAPSAAITRAYVEKENQELASCQVPKDCIRDF
ncbi:hypothetical protein, partial [Thiorhodococcus fuscus]